MDVMIETRVAAKLTYAEKQLLRRAYRAYHEVPPEEYDSTKQDIYTPVALHKVADWMLLITGKLTDDEKLAKSNFDRLFINNVTTLTIHFS